MTKDKDLQDVFMKFHKKISAVLRKEAKKISLTMPQLETLRFVMEQKGSTMNDIAKHLGVTAPSATVMIEHLHKKKLVDRKFDSSDRRTVRVFPIDKDSKFFSLLIKFKARVFGEVFADLNDEDKKKLTVILKKLI